MTPGWRSLPRARFSMCISLCMFGWRRFMRSTSDFCISLRAYTLFVALCFATIIRVKLPTPISSPSSNSVNFFRGGVGNASAPASASFLRCASTDRNMRLKPALHSADDALSSFIARFMVVSAASNFRSCNSADAFRKYPFTNVGSRSIHRSASIVQ